MKVKITLIEEALGSSPSNEELLATYIASQGSHRRPDRGRSLQHQTAAGRGSYHGFSEAGGWPAPSSTTTRSRVCSKIPARPWPPLARRGIRAAARPQRSKPTKKPLRPDFCIPPRDSLRLARPAPGLLRAPAPRQHSAGRGASALPRARACPPGLRQSLKSNASTPPSRRWYANA